VAHPLTVNVGTLPGGVADTAELAAPLEVLAALVALLELVVALLELVVALLELVPELLELVPEALPVPLVDPIVPWMEVIEAVRGSTRAISWKACAQSKRESTSCDTACSRSSRRETKFVYGASRAAAVWACCARALSEAA
jgi:hypothetical protein